MPKQTITRESLDLIDTLFKEELQSDQDEYKPEAKKAKRRASDTGDKRKRAGVKGVPWTPEERVTLFEAMLAGKKGADLEAALPGRSAHQCQTTWARNTVKPLIIRGLREGKSTKQ